MNDLLADLKRWRDLVAAMPEPVAYIVLDHSWSPELPHVDGRDAHGKRYLLCSPAVLDGIRHTRGQPSSLAAIPIYRRENMPEEWPSPPPAR